MIFFLRYFLSLSGSLLMCILLLCRPLLKGRVTKAFAYYIWLIVLLRLLIPVSAPQNAMTALLSFVRADIQTVSGETAAPSGTQSENVQSVQKPQNAMAGMQQNTANVGSVTRTGVLSHTLKLMFIIWLGGACLYLLWTVLSYMHFRSRLTARCVRPRREDVLLFRDMTGRRRVRLLCNQNIDTPMLVGLLSPCVIVPYNAYVAEGRAEELRNILLHELTHYRRLDIAYKWLVVLASALHWFNPFMYLLRREVSHACELSCDEAVIAGMKAGEKQSYGNTLLALSAKRHISKGILATTMCEEKSRLKERLVNIMNYKKQTVWMLAASLLLVGVFAGCGASLGSVSALSDATATPKSSAAETPAPSAATVAPTSVSVDNTAFFADVKDYILKGQGDLSSAESLLWSESFLNVADFAANYDAYLKSGAKEGDVKAFAEYLTKNSKAPDNWKELFEADLKAEYDQKVDSYEDLGDGNYQVYVKIDGKSQPFVVVNSRTGWSHG